MCSIVSYLRREKKQWWWRRLRRQQKSNSQFSDNLFKTFRRFSLQPPTFFCFHTFCKPPQKMSGFVGEKKEHGRCPPVFSCARAFNTRAHPPYGFYRFNYFQMSFKSWLVRLIFQRKKEEGQRTKNQTRWYDFFFHTFKVFFLVSLEKTEVLPFSRVNLLIIHPTM